VGTPVPSRPDTSGLTEAWLRGIPHNPLDPDWSVYDNDIAVITRTYNDYLAKQQGFVPLDPTKAARSNLLPPMSARSRLLISARGVGYLLLRACRLNGPWLPVDNGQTFSDKVRKGDSLDRIAARDHTTVDELRNANPKLNPSALKPGAELSFRHMTEYFFLGFVGRVDEARAAATYNNNDVDGYTKKLLYCMWVFQGGAQAEDAAKAAALAAARKGK
jgi:hypothetical protein